MIYHSFPRVSQEDRFTRAEILDTNGLPAIQDVLLRLPAKTPTRGLSLNNPYGDPVFSIGGGRQSVELYADTNVVAPVINYALCENRAARWCADRKITRVDTLYALDQWIPLAHYKREFPIYKFYFDGPEKYQLYVSSRTANILQFTDSDNRFWAWFGAIPPLGVFHRYPGKPESLDTIHVLGMLSRNVHVFYRIRSRHTFLLARSPERLSSLPVQEAMVQVAPHHGFLLRYICLHVDTERLYVHGSASFVALRQTGLPRIPPKPG